MNGGGCGWLDVSRCRAGLRRLRALVLAIGVLCGCAHHRAHRPGEEYLAGIDFEGNRQLGDEALATGLALRRVLEQGGAPDPHVVQSDADRILGEYLRRGYLDAEVDARIERRGLAARVIYTIEEGPRATTRVVITGLPDDVPAARVRAQLPLEDGAPFSYEVYDQAKPRLLGVIQDAGYARAQLDARVIADPASRTAIIQLLYTPGPKGRFGPVEITGVAGALATAVRERLAFSPGQVYSAAAIVKTQRNLYALGRFSTVRVEPDRTGGAVVAVRIAVVESARREVQLGGGFGIDPNGYEIRGRAGYSIAGWPSQLDTAALDLRPAYAYQRSDGSYQPRIRALGRLERLDLFWTRARSELAAGYRYLTVEAFTSYGPFARAGLETPVSADWLELRVGWRLQQAGFREIDPIIDRNEALKRQLGIDHSERVGGYEQVVAADLRDHPIEPTRGAYGELHATEGTRLAGGAYDYLELVGDVRGYLPLWAGVVVAARARYGAIWGDVPATERLFAGGAVSQRGFSERRLSPSATGTEDGEVVTVPYGGAGLIETSVEVRVPIAEVRSMPLGLAAFLDGGDVTETPGELDVTNLHWAAGGGLRLTTVVGAVRLDVGYRLNRTGPGQPEPGSRYAYHLTIGEAF